MMKLKTILGEGYAWEREAGKPLPTLEQTTAAYAAKMQEQDKPDYIDADGDGNEKESMKKAFADKEDSSFADYSIDALTDMKINLSRYEGNEDQIERINREIAKRKHNESTFTTKAGLQEMREIPLEQRILRNLKGNDYILSETFKK